MYSSWSCQARTYVDMQRAQSSFFNSFLSEVADLGLAAKVKAKLDCVEDARNEAGASRDADMNINIKNVLLFLKLE
eukprot:scaffold2001_cov79-Skeletonema_dohrnii-CCMP3373.AAC.2